MKKNENFTIRNSQENKKINSVIKKSFQVNPVIRKHQVQTLRSGNIRSTLQSGSTKFFNPVIRKYQVNFITRKHRVFKLYDREVTKTKVLVKRSL